MAPHLGSAVGHFRSAAGGGMRKDHALAAGHSRSSPNQPAPGHNRYPHPAAFHRRFAAEQVSSGAEGRP